MKLHYCNTIAYNYIKSRKEDSKKAIVILPGLPTTPKHYEISDALAAEGFDVFVLQYEGTWDSRGVFLERHPADAINEYITALSTGIDIDDIRYVYESVCVLGSSFGGWVSLALDCQAVIKAVCVLSPVIRFSDVVGIETLGTHLQTTLSDRYRFTIDRWNMLISDRMDKERTLPKDSILLIAGAHDTQIPLDDIVDYATHHSINIEVLEQTEHLTLSRLDQECQQKIVSFFKSLT